MLRPMGPKGPPEAPLARAHALPGPLRGPPENCHGPLGSQKGPPGCRKPHLGEILAPNSGQVLKKNILLPMGATAYFFQNYQYYQGRVAKVGGHHGTPLGPRGGAGEGLHFLLYVPSNIDRFSRMWLWLTFRACFFFTKPDLNWVTEVHPKWGVGSGSHLGPVRVPFSTDLGSKVAIFD